MYLYYYEQIRIERGKPNHVISKMILAGIKQLSNN